MQHYGDRLRDFVKGYQFTNSLTHGYMTTVMFEIGIDSEFTAANKFLAHMTMDRAMAVVSMAGAWLQYDEMEQS